MDALKVAVEDLLSELRISPAELEIMAWGYAPDYPGVLPKGGYSNCKVQLSTVTARKLFEALELEETE